MFKKERDLAERSRTLLKNKEVRNFKAEILKHFNGVTEEELNEVIPNKANLTLIKLANKTLLYSLENIVLAFDVNGRGNLYPSLAFLWRFPDALPAFIIHSPVSEFVLRGADLMVPGLATIQGLEDIHSGGKVAVKVRNNPLPFAVGEAVVSYEALAVQGQRKGKAMNVLHLYGDYITPEKSVPNSGFGSSCIYGLTDDTNDIVPAQVVIDQTEPMNEMNNTDITDVECKLVEGTVNDDDGAQHIKASDEYNDVNADNTAADTSEEDRTHSHDMNLQRALMLTLKYMLKDKQLPMLVSTFWALIQRCAHEDGIEPLEIKKSSFKKVSSFLSDYCDKRHGLLSIKNENGVSTVVRINKGHEWFAGVKPSKLNAEDFKAAVLSNSSTTGSTMNSTPSSDFAAIASSNGSKGFGNKGEENKISVIELYKLTKHLRDIFGTTRGQYGEYLKTSEMRDVVMMYMKNANMEDAQDRARVIIPGIDPLYNILWKLLASVNQHNSAPPPSVEVKDEIDSDDDHKLVSSMKKSCTRNSVARSNVSWGANVTGGDDDEDECALLDEEPALTSSLLQQQLHFTKEPSSEIKMKVREGGLLPVENLSTDHTVRPPQPPSQNVSNAYFESNFPALSAPSGASSTNTTTSSWKAVTLSTKRAEATAQSIRQHQAAKPEIQRGSVSGNSSSTTSKRNNEVVEDNNGTLCVRKEEFFKAILSKASPYCAIIGRDGSCNIRSGQLPKVKIIVESRMGNKTVTLIRGLEVFGIDMAVFSKQSQKRFACSVALSSVPGIPKDKEIILQGNFAHEAEAYLVDVFCLPRHLIELTTAKGGKLKKKK